MLIEIRNTLSSGLLTQRCIVIGTVKQLKVTLMLFYNKVIR